MDNIRPRVVHLCTEIRYKNNTNHACENIDIKKNIISIYIFIRDPMILYRTIRLIIVYYVI